ncbi:MAG: RAMP superfamily CRISPR-associated protein [Aigarchaeota archaeon]|nr:RAMP superfamily CRISPR-associated protein [Candidatus Pelearchaeum maunauluense]
MKEIKVYLKPVTLLSIGSGVEEAVGSDIVQIRTRTERGLVPYIPGSSVKGALRSAVSRVARNYGFESCGETLPEYVKARHVEMLKEGKECDVCYVFGQPGPSVSNMGKAVFSPFYPDGEVTVTSITRVRLEDSSLRAHEGALYTAECIVPGQTFSGSIRIIARRNGDVRKTLQLLLLSLASLRTDRIGRSGITDVRIELADDLKALLDSKWRSLASDLEGWFWVDM